MKCHRDSCNGELKIKRVMFRNGKEHFRSWCPICKHGQYEEKTPENEIIFALAKLKKSKALQVLDRVKYESSPQSTLGRFGSDWELLFATNLKQKYFATALRRGCPDFFIECKGKLFFVEIKHGNDHLSRYQKIFRDMLERAGIKVFLSNGRLTPEIEDYINE